jgi:hypothetical protein
MLAVRIGIRARVNLSNLNIPCYLGSMKYRTTRCAHSVLRNRHTNETSSIPRPARPILDPGSPILDPRATPRTSRSPLSRSWPPRRSCCPPAPDAPLSSSTGIMSAGWPHRSWMAQTVAGRRQPRGKPSPAPVARPHARFIRLRRRGAPSPRSCSHDDIGADGPVLLLAAPPAATPPRSGAERSRPSATVGWRP